MRERYAKGATGNKKTPMLSLEEVKTAAGNKAAFKGPE
jgi:hypothetical protein